MSFHVDGGPQLSPDARLLDSSQTSDSIYPDAFSPDSTKALLNSFGQIIVEGEWAPGLSVGISTEKGSEFYNYGKISLSDNQTPNENTIYELGDLTETFTNLLLALMVEDQSVTLGQPVQQLLPQDKVTLSTYQGKEITLKHLATHTSGLPNLPKPYLPVDYTNPYKHYTAEQMYSYLSYYELTEEPGSSWLHSILGMALLGHALSLKANLSFADLIRERITTPLEMTDTVIQMTDEQRKRFASGHDGELNPISSWDFDVLAPAGALHSTTKDLLRFAAAQIGLQQTSLSTAMESTHLPQLNTGGTDNMGLGWYISADNRVLWQGGNTAGFSSFIGLIPAKKIALVVLMNGLSTYAPEQRLGFNVLEWLSGGGAKPLDLPTTITLPVATLDQYVGTYQYDEDADIQLEVFRKGELLYLNKPDQGDFRLYAQSVDSFYLRADSITITFKKGSSGNYDTMIFQKDKEEPLTLHRIK